MPGTINGIGTIYLGRQDLTRSTDADGYRFQALLSSGKLDEALAAGNGAGLEKQWAHQLSVSLAAHALHRSDVADGMRTLATETLSRLSLAEQATAEMLRTPRQVDIDRAAELAMGALLPPEGGPEGD